MLLLWVAIAIAQDDTGTPPAGVGGMGTVGGGGGGGLGSISIGTYEPPPPPEKTPLGDDVDALGRPLPEIATARLGDGRWSPGQSADGVALHGDHVLLGGDDGVSLFDRSTGALIERLDTADVTAVRFTDDGRPAWMTLFDGLQVDGKRQRPDGCWNVSPHDFDVARGEIVWMCDDSLYVGDRALEVELEDPMFVEAADKEALVWAQYGAWRVSLKGKGKILETWSADIADAAWHDDTLALVRDGELHVDGRAVRVKSAERILRVGWSPDGRLAVLADDGLHILAGKRYRERCHVELNAVGDLAWGERIWVGDSRSTAPTRVDPDACEIVSTPGGQAPTHLLHTGHGIVTGNGDVITLWDPESNTVIGRFERDHHALGVRPDGTVSVVNRRYGLDGVLSLPSLAFEEVEQPDRHALEMPRLISFSIDGPRGPDLPTVASAAAGGPVVAWGLEDFRIRLDDQPLSYDFTDYVNLHVRGPYSSMYGGFGGLGVRGPGGHGDPPPEPDPDWDGSAVRPRQLHLEDVDVSADGRRVAMLWTYVVTDAYGDEDQQHWLGVLDPTRDALAGLNLNNTPDRVAISADGTHVLWQSDYRTSALALDTSEDGDGQDTGLDTAVDEAEWQDTGSFEDEELDRWEGEWLDTAQETADDTAVDDTAALADEDEVLRRPEDAVGIQEALESDLGVGPLSNIFGSDDAFGDAMDEVTMGGSLGGPVHRGLAQQLPDRDRITLPSLQGRDTAAALSADGAFVALGTDKETALFRWGEDEPVWQYDLRQGGTVGLVFDQGLLWVLGADGTILGIPVGD